MEPGKRLLEVGLWPDSEDRLANSWRRNRCGCVTASFRSGRYLRTRIFRRHWGGRREQMRCTSKTRTKWIEQSVFRVPIATMEMERVTRFGDLLSVGATRCISREWVPVSRCTLPLITAAWRCTPSIWSYLRIVLRHRIQVERNKLLPPRPLRFIWLRLAWLAGFEW